MIQFGGVKMNKNLNNIAIAGVIAALLLIPQAVLEFLRGAGKLTSNLLPIYLIVTIIAVGTYIYFIWGFKIIGDKTKNKLLTMSSYLLIILTIATYIITFLFQNGSTLTQAISGVVVIVLLGAASIPFGIGLLKLKKEFGGLATATGVLNIITGVSFVTVILIFIGLLVLIPLIVLEIMLMFKAAKKL